MDEPTGRECRILCVTKYGRGRRDKLFHQDIKGPAAIFETPTNKCGDVETVSTAIRFQGNTYVIQAMRPGLDGSCVAFAIDTTDPYYPFWLLYSDIPAKNASVSAIEDRARFEIDRRRPRV